MAVRHVSGPRPARPQPIAATAAGWQRHHRPAASRPARGWPRPAPTVRCFSQKAGRAPAALVRPRRWQARGNDRVSRRKQARETRRDRPTRTSPGARTPFPWGTGSIVHAKLCELRHIVATPSCLWCLACSRDDVQGAALHGRTSQGVGAAMPPRPGSAPPPGRSRSVGNPSSQDSSRDHRRHHRAERASFRRARHCPSLPPLGQLRERPGEHITVTCRQRLANTARRPVRPRTAPASGGRRCPPGSCRGRPWSRHALASNHPHHLQLEGRIKAAANGSIHVVDPRWRE